MNMNLTRSLSLNDTFGIYAVVSVRKGGTPR